MCQTPVLFVSDWRCDDFATFNIVDENRLRLLLSENGKTF